MTANIRTRIYQLLPDPEWCNPEYYKPMDLKEQDLFEPITREEVVILRYLLLDILTHFQKNEIPIPSMALDQYNVPIFEWMFLMSTNVGSFTRNSVVAYVVDDFCILGSDGETQRIPIKNRSYEKLSEALKPLLKRIGVM